MAAGSVRGLFSARMLVIHVVAVALIAGMVAMGWWQSDRYDAQRAAASARASATARAAAPVPLDSVLGPDSAFPSDQAGVKVTATGRYAPLTQQFFVRGKQHRGRTGYWVLTPLLTGQSAILVVRGWVQDLAHPAANQAPTGRVAVTGWLEPAEPVSAKAQPPTQADRIISSVSPASLVGLVPYDLYGGYLVLAKQKPPEPRLPTVARPNQEVSTSAGWRNLAYAGQWWLFAAFVAFMWWRIVRDAR